MSRRRSQRAKRAAMNLPGPLGTLQTRLLDAWHQRAVSLKALSFATVGLVNTAVDAAVFFLLLVYATPSLVVANVGAWLVAVSGSYVINSFTTFSAETGGKLGFITPMTHNFCESCNRVRITCTGTLHTCLGHEDASDLRRPLRASADDDLLSAAIDRAIGLKPKGHDFIIDRRHNRPSVSRHMSVTGG